MASVKPSVPRGTRDFSPAEMAKRNYIFDTIKTVFRKYGYQQIETPAMENLSTLMGKYGDEGDKLIFKIRSNNNLHDFLLEKHTDDLSRKIINDFFELYKYDFVPRASDKSLRYDLTVPFARYVV